jgi:hypothetical protein
MKKNVKKVVEAEIENVIYKSENISLCRVNNIIHLFGYQDLTINEVFEIFVWGIKNRMDDAEFWNVKLTTADKQNARSINIIYWLTGGDKIWKSHNWIWRKEWNEMSLIFLEHFDEKIIKIVQSSKTMGDLRNKIQNRLSSEDFYEFGLSLDIINKDETLL